MFKKVLLCASAAVLMASCSEEELAWTSGTSGQKVVQPENDLTFGYNSIITETDSLSTVSIPLNTDVAPVISCRDGVADLQCVKVDGKYYLQVAHPEKAKMGVDEVTLTVKDHPELNKSFLFTVNNSTPQTRANEADPITKRFAKVFSVGQYLWKGANNDHPTYPMFKSDSLISMVVKDEQYDLSNEDERITGSSLQDLSDNTSISFGVSKIPIASVLFGFDASFTKKTVSKNYYEYLTESEIRKSAAASLNLRLLTIPANDKRWKHYITDELDDVLNNPGSDLYKAFPTDTAGACDIIDKFGSHLLTYCVLGAKATLEFRKKQDITQTSLDEAVNATISVKTAASSGPTPEDWSDVIVAQYLASKRPTGNIGYKCSKSDYAEETEAEWHTKLIGGNANTVKDIKDWFATDDPEKWIPVAFRKDKKEDAFMRAIYEFCQDTISERYKSLKYVMEAKDKNGVCPYIKWKHDVYGVDISDKATEWVLGDVFVYDDKNSKNYHPAPRKMELYNHYECTFYPYMDLAFNSWNCLDTQTDDFGGSHDNGHYWYYAMVMRDDFEGLEDIRLVHEEDKQRFLNDGYHVCLDTHAANFRSGWSAFEKNHYVLMAKAIEPGNPKKIKPLTGLALEAWYRPDKSGECRLLGVSGATGKNPNGTLGKRYDYYWNPPMFGPGSYPGKYVKDQDGNVNPVYYFYMTHQPWYLFLKTTNIPIRPEDVYINNPSDMRNMSN